ncbi:hypothetical protein HHK36_009762 [Tetracentron sinense]|uniref:Uncharacterized protein n=1 Tax=Tetracentron sinense TaxID=13715 RepID=A0A834ZJK5_TETSI|nr:hypothetical protein HHK36_009762 [Tetracentron sinense]
MGFIFVTGSWGLSSRTAASQVVKSPFLWMGLSPEGGPMNLLDPDCRFKSSGDFVSADESEFSGPDLVPVNIGFLEKIHVTVDKNPNFTFSCSSEQRKMGLRRSSSSSDSGIVEDESTLPRSLSDRLMLENYQNFANQTSPGGERAFGRWRKREKELQGTQNGNQRYSLGCKVVFIDMDSIIMKEPCYYSYVPKQIVPFYNSIGCINFTIEMLEAGIWKQRQSCRGICDYMSLDFYIVAYDDIGGIACQRDGESSEAFCSYSSVFWTSNITFIESPFSSEEEY